MPSLSEGDKARCRIHLCYVMDAVDSGDSALLEDRMANIGSETERCHISKLLDKCDKYWRELFDPGTELNSVSTTIGDINRTQTVDVSRTRKQREDDYLLVVEYLALQLAVPNYRKLFKMYRAFSVQNRYSALPRGHSDTCRSDKLYLSCRYS